MALDDLKLKKVKFNSPLGIALYNYGRLKPNGDRGWATINPEAMYKECRGCMDTEIISGDVNSYVEIGLLAGFETPEDEAVFILRWS